MKEYRDNASAGASLSWVSCRRKKKGPHPIRSAAILSFCGNSLVQLFADSLSHHCPNTFTESRKTLISQKILVGAIGLEPN